MMQNFSDLLPRIVTGVLLVAALIGAIFLGKIAWMSAALLILLVLIFEVFHVICKPQTKMPTSLLLYMLFSLQLLIGYFYFYSFGWMAVIGFTLLMGLLLAGFYRYKAKQTMSLLLVMHYVAFAIAASIFIYESPNGHLQLLWLFLLVWISDTGAYLAGRIVGGPRIWPKISPKKTWSGFIGAFLAVFLATFLLGQFTNMPHFSYVMAGALCLSAQIGDFIESYFKRLWNVKDMSNLLPGHGGLFDRFDSVLLCMITMYLIQSFA